MAQPVSHVLGLDQTPGSVDIGSYWGEDRSSFYRNSLGLQLLMGIVRSRSQTLHTLPALSSNSTNSDHGATSCKVRVNFVNEAGLTMTASVAEGESMLDAVVNKNLDISGFGACEGTLACSTCHLIFDESVYERLEPMQDEEMDMLDLAYGLTKTSRLGCQVLAQPWMDGMTVRVPQELTDQRDSKEAKGNQ
ncbi:ferredoxin 1b [Chanos chanos]|uniref:Ferredoxin 1b n=1 Tax=Chanos chanos TaxID=29144 RepID=A0A6J2WV94_CHACN|nr:adrenodoxin-like [Chanos chanos]